MCQHLEDLQNSVNQHFPNDKCMMLQNHARVKDPFKVQAIAIDCNPIAYEKFIDIFSEFHIVTNF